MKSYDLRNAPTYKDDLAFKKSAMKGITPDIDSALKKLGVYIPIQDPQKSRADYASTKNLSPEELKEKVRQLNASGDRIAACALAKKALRCSTTEAMKFVEN